jgi:hypothetical protein
MHVVPAQKSEHLFWVQGFILFEWVQRFQMLSFENEGQDVAAKEHIGMDGVEGV